MCPCSFLVFCLAIMPPDTNHDQFCSNDVAKFLPAGVNSTVGFRMNESFIPSGIHDGRKHLL